MQSFSITGNLKKETLPSGAIEYIWTFEKFIVKFLVDNFTFVVQSEGHPSVSQHVFSQFTLDEKDGMIKIENSYMRFSNVEPRHNEKMFLNLAKIFDVSIVTNQFKQ